jgi:cytochrome c biogenesis factor
MAGAPNPEAIAWYVKRSEDLLDDLRTQVESLRTRGAQLAGFSGAVLALAGANLGSILDGLHGVARDCAGTWLLIGVLFLVASLVTALLGTLLPRLESEISVEEISRYTSERFTHETEIWRVHVRTIRGMLTLIESIRVVGDDAARAVKKAEYLFLAGLLSVGVALAILISVVTF